MSPEEAITRLREAGLYVKEADEEGRIFGGGSQERIAGLEGIRNAFILLPLGDGLYDVLVVSDCQRDAQRHLPLDEAVTFVIQNSKEVPDPVFMGVRLTRIQVPWAVGYWAYSVEGTDCLHVTVYEHRLTKYRSPNQLPWVATMTLLHRYGSGKDHVKIYVDVTGQTAEEVLSKLEEAVRAGVPSAQWVVDVLERASSTGSLSLG